MTPGRPGHALPYLLAGALRSLVDALHEQLAEQGHAGARPVHGFALQAIGADGATTVELARRLGVSKQAAAKTVAGLEGLGYVERRHDPADARARPIVITEHGHDMLARSAQGFADLRRRFVGQVGAARAEALEDGLEQLIASSGEGRRTADLPGWLT